MTGLTRGQLLARTAAGGAAFALTGGVFASEAAAGAEAIGPGDIPVVTLALAAELLGAEFYTQALAAKVFGGNETRVPEAGALNEGEHYTAPPRS